MLVDNMLGQFHLWLTVTPGDRADPSVPCFSSTLFSGNCVFQKVTVIKHKQLLHCYNCRAWIVCDDGDKDYAAVPGAWQSGLVGYILSHNTAT